MKSHVFPNLPFFPFMWEDFKSVFCFHVLHKRLRNSRKLENRVLVYGSFRHATSGRTQLSVAEISIHVSGRFVFVSFFYSVLVIGDLLNPPFAMRNMEISLAVLRSQLSENWMPFLLLQSREGRESLQSTPSQHFLSASARVIKLTIDILLLSTFIGTM